MRPSLSRARSAPSWQAHLCLLWTRAQQLRRMLSLRLSQTEAMALLLRPQAGQDSLPLQSRPRHAQQVQTGLCATPTCSSYLSQVQWSQRHIASPSYIPRGAVSSSPDLFDWRKQQQHSKSPGCAGGETPRSSTVRSRVRSASARLRKGVIGSADGSPGSASVPRELRENSQVPPLVAFSMLEVSLDDCRQCQGSA